MSHKVARAFLYRDAFDVVRLLREEEARTLIGAASVEAGTVEDTMVGKEVMP